MLRMFDVKISTSSHVFLRKIIVLIFIAVTTVLFFYLNKVQPHYYIDEIFHIPQTMRFCDGNFNEWDKKITTFPGLYLIATAFLGPFNLCTTIFLRGVNLVGTFLNFYVIYELLKIVSGSGEKIKRGKTDETKNWMRLISSLNIALLPPLYFLLFLYYTDVISTNMVLLMYLFYLKKKFKTSALIGTRDSIVNLLCEDLYISDLNTNLKHEGPAKITATQGTFRTSWFFICVLAVLLRQTNIVWVAWLCSERGMDIIENKNPKRIHKSFKNTPAHIKLLWENTKEELNGGRLFEFLSEILLSLFPYIIIGLIFVLFVIWNEGIVLGDRSAHIATIHVPQIFYYSSFLCFFAWPFFLPYVIDFIKFLKNRCFLVSIAFALMAVIVRFNTLVHPYLLADNRHYTFYVWNRLIGRYQFAKYILIPFYLFSIYSTIRGINHYRFLSKIVYLFITFAVLVPQLLLEPRYFLIPYIIFRINLTDPKPWQIFAEFISTIVVNVFQFFLFSNKVFYWEDDVNPQRISW